MHENRHTMPSLDTLESYKYDQTRKDSTFPRSLIGLPGPGACAHIPLSKNQIHHKQISLSLMQGRFPYFIHEFEPCRTIRTASCRHGVFRTARQTSHGIRHLSLKVKLSHSLGKLVSATFSVLNLGPLRSYKARSFSNRSPPRAEALIYSPSMRDQRPGSEEQPTRFDLRCRSRPIDRDVDASANFERP